MTNIMQQLTVTNPNKGLLKERKKGLQAPEG